MSNSATEQEFLQTLLLQTENDSAEWSWNSRVYYCPKIGACLSFYPIFNAELTVNNQRLIAGWKKLSPLRKAIKLNIIRKENRRRLSYYNEQEAKRIERLQIALKQLVK